MKIALATSKELPGLDPDDHPYLKSLKERGVEVTLPIWDDPAAESQWVDADLVVVRSTWDYSEKHAAFIDWAAKVDERTTLMNPSAMIDWNSDKKRYLSDLAAHRVPTVPTAWLDVVDKKSKKKADVAALAKDRGWGFGPGKGLVIKPVIGAGSRDTLLAEDAKQAQAFVDEQLPKQALMVQPFLPRIKDGEVSLVFIDGVFSHAVIKKPKEGDFRSQPEFGSVVETHTPTTRERDLADHTFHIMGARPLYARVDIITGLDDKPCLLELEVVEPSLYLAWSDSAAEAFAEATIRRATKK